MNEENDLLQVTEIDRLIHEPARLKIILYLYLVENADFIFLLRKTGLSKGNLSVQLQNLEAAGYVEIEKSFVERISRTMICLTPKGRKAFQDYKTNINSILQQTDEKEE